MGKVAKEIYVLGVGHNTPVFIDLALACGYSVAGLYHYTEGRTGETDHGFKVLGTFEDLLRQSTLEGKCFLLSMGDIEIRKSLTRQITDMGGVLPSLIHPMAVISSFATISEKGVLISPFTYVQADSVVEEGVVLLSHVNISHNTTIGRFTFVAGGSAIGAYTEVEEEVFVGQGALSISHKVSRIGHNAFIGAGSLLTKDVASNVTVAGSPAKVIDK